jgi:hypothetical protein
MADFWGGFGQGFGRSFESSYDRAARRRELREQREYAEKREDAKEKKKREREEALLRATLATTLDKPYSSVKETPRKVEWDEVSRRPVDQGGMPSPLFGGKETAWERDVTEAKSKQDVLREMNLEELMAASKTAEAGKEAYLDKRKDQKEAHKAYINAGAPSLGLDTYSLPWQGWAELTGVFKKGEKDELEQFTSDLKNATSLGASNDDEGLGLLLRNYQGRQEGILRDTFDIAQRDAKKVKRDKKQEHKLSERAKQKTKTFDDAEKRITEWGVLAYLGSDEKPLKELAAREWGKFSDSQRDSLMNTFRDLSTVGTAASFDKKQTSRKALEQKYMGISRKRLDSLHELWPASELSKENLTEKATLSADGQEVPYDEDSHKGQVTWERIIPTMGHKALATVDKRVASSWDPLTGVATDWTVVRVPKELFETPTPPKAKPKSAMSTLEAYDKTLDLGLDFTQFQHGIGQWVPVGKNNSSFIKIKNLILDPDSDYQELSDKEKEVFYNSLGIPRGKEKDIKALLTFHDADPDEFMKALKFLNENGWEELYRKLNE